MTDGLATVGGAVERFLAQFPAEHRADSVHLALLSLRSKINDDLAILAELAFESNERGYWSVLNDEHGRPYLSAEDYFERVLHLGSWRSIYRYIAAGRLIASVPEGAERDAVRAIISSAVGVSKAAIIEPVIAQQPDARAAWLERASRESVAELQRHVTDVVTGSTRGSGAAPADRFRALLLNCAPDLDARALFERILELGAHPKITGSGNAVGILVALAQEVLPEWEARCVGRLEPEDDS